MLTLQELKKEVEIPGFDKKIPTAKQLRESGRLIEMEELSEDTEICVYQNGYVFYRVGSHSTVFPLYFADFGCYIALVVLLFLLIKGVPVLGVFLILLGVTIFLTFLTKVFYNLLYGNKKIYCYSLIISAVFFVSGCFFSIGTLTEFEVYHGLPDNSFAQKEIVYDKTVTNDSFHISYYDYEVQEDNSLEDNQIKLVISYYSDFISDVVIEEKDLEDSTFYRLNPKHKSVSKANRKKVYNMVMRELKNLRWYHYSELGDLKIVVQANANTIHKLK